MRTIEEIQSHFSDLEDELKAAVEERLRAITAPHVQRFIDGGMSCLRVGYCSDGRYRDLTMEWFAPPTPFAKTNTVLVKIVCYRDKAESSANCLFHRVMECFEVITPARTALDTLRAWELCAEEDAAEMEAERDELAFEAARAQEREDPDFVPADPPPHDPAFDTIPDPFADA